MNGIKFVPYIATTDLASTKIAKGTAIAKKINGVQGYSIFPPLFKKVETLTHSGEIRSRVYILGKMFFGKNVRMDYSGIQFNGFNFKTGIFDFLKKFKETTITQKRALHKVA